MSTPLKVPPLDYAQIGASADRFLARYHPDGKIPVPIEHIVEFQLELDIVPLPGLLEAYEVVGFTASDLTAISVDQRVYERWPRRYRFTLAHETGHVILHAHLFKEHTFRTVDSWKRFVNALPAIELGRLEWQAHSFAGLVLVPKDALASVIKAHGRRMSVPKLQHEKDFAKDLVIERAAGDFDVSKEVVERRLGYDQFNWTSVWP